MAQIINTTQDLINAVNAGGFETFDQFVKFLQIGRLQTEIGAYTVANNVLDAQVAGLRQANETQKQANNDAVAARQALLAQLVNS